MLAQGFILRIVRHSIWLLLLAAAPAFGQAPLDASRLPADTLFYLHWRGIGATAAARETNSLLRLWADPEFAPMREAILQGFRDGLKKNKESGAWAPDEILSLLENPLLIGYVGPLELPAPSGSAPAAKSSTDNRLFVVYDASGKTELLLKMKNRWLVETKDPPAISDYAFGAITVEKYVEKNQTFYRAQVGSSFVQAGQQALIEDLISRLRSLEEPANSLRNIREFQLARRQSDSGTVAEFFGRVPDVSTIPIPPGKDFDGAAFVQGMRLKSLHAFCANLSFQGRAARLRFAVLGETAPGGLLELAGENKPIFATLPLAPAGTLSYSGWRVNLTAIYQTIRSALSAALGPKQRTTLDLGEAMIANQIEMKLPEALQLFTGEGASISASGDLEPASQLYALTIQKPPEVLRLLRVLLSSFKPVEEHDGDTTFVRLSSRPTTGTAAPDKSGPSFYLAVTPQMLLAGANKDMLQQALARLRSANPADSASLAAEPGFRSARSRYPESLISLSYLDFSRMPWEKMMQSFRGANKKAGDKPTPGAAGADDMLKQFSPAVLRRHLHTMGSASWKDADGFFSDIFVE